MPLIIITNNISAARNAAKMMYFPILNTSRNINYTLNHNNLINILIWGFNFGIITNAKVAMKT
jgi:hypothetical protein